MSCDISDPKFLDGADPQTTLSGGKPQAEYIEEIKAHIRTARATFSMLTKESLEALIADEDIGRACVEGLLGTVQGMVKPKDPGRVEDIGPEKDGWITIHFLPSGLHYDSRPSAKRVSNYINASMHQVQFRAPGSFQAITKSFWTSRGDLALFLPSTDADSHLKALDLSSLFDSRVQGKLNHGLKPYLRRQGTTLTFLRIHDTVSVYSWENKRAVFPVGPQHSGRNSPFWLPDGFDIVVEHPRIAPYLWDTLVDISGLGEAERKRLEKACGNSKLSIRAMGKEEPYADYSVSVLILEDE